MGDAPPDLDEIEGYRLIRVLGRGGMGIVYLAQLLEDRPHAPAGSTVALKLLRQDFATEGGARRDRLLREARLGLAIAHPAVVRTLEVVTHVRDGREHAAIVLEFVEGRTLRDQIDRFKTLPESLVRHVGAETAHGLAAVHAADAVHRDVKPPNIIVTPQQHVKLMDLGIARLLEESRPLTTPGGFVGTVAYASPEQIRGAPVGPRSDIYSLGVTLYEAATGTLPFESRDTFDLMQQHLWRVPKRADAVNPAISQVLSDLLAWMLEKDPASRPASASFVAELLERGEVSEWFRSQRVGARAGGAAIRVPVPARARVVGRENELEGLRTHFEAAFRGEGGVVELIGESGVGKTRLMHEFVRRLDEAGDDVLVLYGAHPPGGAGGWLAPYAESIVDALGGGELATRLRDMLGVTENIARSFAALLTWRHISSDLEQLSIEAVHALFSQLGQRLALERSLVWIVDDVGHAPVEARALLLTLARATRGSRMLLMVASEASGRIADFAQGRVEGTTRVDVERLGNEDALALVKELVGGQGVVDEIGGRVVEVAQGNPLFVLELVQELERTGALDRGSGGSKPSGSDLARMTLPRGVRDVVAARAADLTPDERRLLEVGALEGHEFDPDLIARVHGLQRLHVLQTLAEIERRTGLIKSKGRRFTFDHRSVRDIILHDLSPPLACEYHGMLADACLARDAVGGAPESLDGETAAFVVRHWLEGDRGRDAVGLLGRALMHHRQRYENAAGVELAALALADRAFADPGRRCDVLLDQASFLSLLAQREGERSGVAEAMSCARRADDRARSARAGAALARLHLAVSDYGAALPVARTCLEDAKAAGLRDIQATAIGQLSLVAANTGETLRALQLTAECVATWREIGNRKDGARAARNHAALLRHVGRHDEARTTFEEHAAACAEVGDLQGEASLLGGLALVHLDVGEHDRARTCLDRQVALSVAIGDRAQEATAAGNLASLHLEVGRYDLAGESLARCLRLAGLSGNRKAEATARGNLGDLALREGRLVAAREHLEKCLATARELTLRRVEAHALIDLGRCALVAGDLEAARAHSIAGLTLARDLRIPRTLAEAATGLGRVLAVTGAHGEAVEGMREAEEACAKAGLHDIECLPAAWLAWLGARDGSTVVIDPKAPVSVRAEALRVLHAATGNTAFADEARIVLEGLCAHLTPAEVAGFWKAQEQPALDR